MKVDSLTHSSKFEVIEEVDEDLAMAEIEKVEKESSIQIINDDEELKEEEQKKDFKINLKIAPIDLSLSKAQTF